MEESRYASHSRKRDRHWTSNFRLTGTSPEYLGIVRLFVKSERHAGDRLAFQPNIAGRNFEPDPLPSFRKAAHVAPSFSSSRAQFVEIATPKSTAPDYAVMPL